MNRVEAVFGRKHVLLPVVHPVDRARALVAVDVAVRGGGDGIFLINQGLNEKEVLALINEVRGRHPDLWIGLNLLGRSPAEALRVAVETCGRIDGIWSDNAGVDERTEAQPVAHAFVEMRERLGWKGLYFGGVAFKYQREVPAAQLGRAAALAGRYMDVVCTSGPGTGQAADPAKPAAMRAGAPDVAIALASGVTTANVHAYLPYVNAYLVGTGIERELGVLDPAEVEKLAAAIHAAC